MGRPRDPARGLVTGAERSDHRARFRRHRRPGRPPPPPAAGAPVAPRPPPAAGGTPLVTQRALGWIAVGTGAAGLVAGGITFGVASGLRSDLVRLGCTEAVECPDTPATRDKLGTYNTVRLVPAPAFIAGGVLAAGGVALLFTAPSTPKSRGATARPWISPWGAGIVGVF